MRLLYLVPGFILMVSVMRVGEAADLRTWTDVKGNHVEAAFVKLEGSDLLLQLKDGKKVPTKIENLCAEDRAYVTDLTYVPREVTALFKNSRFGTGGEESGVSPVATVRDTVVIRLTDERDGNKESTTGDSRWKIESVDSLGNRIVPRKEGYAEELVTEGKFIFVIYSVANDSNFPIPIPAPILTDKRGRRFLPKDTFQARYFIPEGTLLAGVDPVPPGFKKRFCSIYELPLEADPASVEVFPTKTSSFAIQRFEAKGKHIVIDGTTRPAESQKEADAVVTGVSGKKVSVFMKCVRVGQGGDTSGYWFYDRNKKRSLSYGIELRVIGDERQSVTVKAFFIGTISNNRDAVVDRKEESVVLEPGKIARVSLQSDEVEEYTYYYYSDSRISGAKLKGVIVQVWNENAIVASFASLNQWKKYSDSPDLVKQMGELTKRERGF